MTLYRRLVLLALLLTAVVVVFGAYVRLADAGLGCPDWPGCYGQLSPHHAADQIGAAHAADPAGPVSPAKAWKEMLHRYLAASLGVLILAIAALAWRHRTHPAAAPWVATALVGVVVFQGLLGKWTVTLLLKPAIVTGHLLGGLTTLGLLCWLALRAHGAPRSARAAPVPLAMGARLGLVLLAVQIALGGWTSTNYAALACTDFPACHGSYWPAADYANAFHLVRELGMTADGDLLPLSALTAIHWTHRVGAALVGGYLLLFGCALARRDRAAAAMLVAGVLVQLGLGVANVLLSLPLPLAAAHNAGAALLVVLMVWINWRFAGEGRAYRAPAGNFSAGARVLAQPCVGRIGNGRG